MDIVIFIAKALIVVSISFLAIGFVFHYFGWSIDDIRSDDKVDK